MPPVLAHPFDDDKLREECGIFGVIGLQDAATLPGGSKRDCLLTLAEGYRALADLKRMVLRKAD